MTLLICISYLVFCSLNNHIHTDTYMFYSYMCTCRHALAYALTHTHAHTDAYIYTVHSYHFKAPKNVSLRVPVTTK